VSIAWRTYVGLVLVSFVTLMVEVALTRFFSFSIWYHFAYMTISVALLGYGAAGSIYYAFPTLTTPQAVERTLGGWSLLAALLLVGGLMVAAKVPFDPVKFFPAGHVSWRAAGVRQLLYLSVLYLAVMAPFFAMGMCVTILLANAPQRIPQLYSADLLGAGGGCIAAVSLLAWLGAPGLIVLGSALLAVASVSFGWAAAPARRRGITVLALLVVAGVPLARLGEPQASATKFLHRLLSDGKLAVLFTRWNPVYRVDVVGGRNGLKIRFGRSAAWGVGERFTGTPPENLIITHDGDASTMMYKFDGDFANVEMLDHSLLRLPYLMLPAPQVLVIGVGGGVDVLTALRGHARHVTGIELNPATVDVLAHEFAEYNGNLFNRPDVTLLVDEGRNFVRRGGQRYDLIQITGIDTLAAIYSGAYVLSESYLYTVEAMREYLDHLSPDGMVAIVRGDAQSADVAPRQVLRLLSVATEALRQTGLDDPSRHIVVMMARVRNSLLSIFSVLVRRSPFSEQEVARVKGYASSEGFEPWYLPGERLGTPAEDLIMRSAAERDRYLAQQWFDLSPTTDDRPFFFNFLKWRSLLEATRRQADYTFASGQLVLVAILVQSVIFAVLLIVAPLFRVGFGEAGKGRWRYLLYFGCLGIGFIFIEISYIQRFTLFLGSPVFSLSVILFTLLLSSGTGSFLSGRLRLLADARRALLLLVVALCVVNVAYIEGLPAIFNLFLGNALAVRIAVAAVLLAPAGLIMGAFLPVGMRVLSASAPQVIAWAWAANGVASVVGSILCIVLAISIGFRLVNLVALGVYVVGVAALLGPARAAVATTSQPERSAA